MIKVYATLSQLNYSFDEFKVVSLTGIWSNVKKEKGKKKKKKKKKVSARMSKK